MGYRLMFRSGQEQIALPADVVREVVSLGRLTRVPHAPSALLGLGNVRGTVMPMVSLDRLLDKPASAGRRVIILDRHDPVGLVVEDVPRLVDDRDDLGRSIDIDPLLGSRFATGDQAARTARASHLPSLPRVRETDGANQDLLAILAFRAAGQRFALPLDQIDELVALPGDIAHLPGSDVVALGFVVHRGGLLPLLSLSALLGLSATVTAPKPRIVITRIKNVLVGLVVDAVDTILRVAEQDIDPLPLVLSRGGAEAKIQAIVRDDDGRSLVSLLATDHLLSEAIMSRLQGDEGRTSQDQARSEEAVEQFLVFRLGEEEFGLPIASVREVVTMPTRLTRVPKAPPFVLGVTNLRGRAVPLIDQRDRFEVQGEAQTRRRVIITTLGDLEVGFVVDAASEVLRVAVNQLSPAPAMGEDTRVFDRVASLAGGRTVLVIQPQELLDRAEHDVLVAMGKRKAAAKP